MNLRLILEQSHGEFLTVEKTAMFQTLLAEMEIVVFPLIDSPITFEKIKDDHILFIGCPSIPFDDSEISAILQFVGEGNFLILISGSGGDYANNSNLNEIARYYEFEFNPDYVEDEKHHHNFSRIPIIHKFKKNPIVKRLKKLVYAGCSISILDISTVPILLTDSDSIPVNSPVMALSEKHSVFGIGGHAFFTDDPISGIRTMDNIRFVYNLFEYIKSRFTKKVEDIEKVLITKPKQLTLKVAKKQFNKLLTINTEKVNELGKKIDKYWEECSALIKVQKFDQAEQMISSSYQELLQSIDLVASQIGNTFSEYNALFPKFKGVVLNDFNQWYETEAEIRAKLDMIRNNLKTIWKQEQSQA